MSVAPGEKGRRSPQSSATGLQIGVANVVRGKQRGLQIGVANHAESLEGIQIGLLNMAAGGGLHFMVGLNVGW